MAQDTHTHTCTHTGIVKRAVMRWQPILSTTSHPYNTIANVTSPGPDVEANLLSGHGRGQGHARQLSLLYMTVPAVAASGGLALSWSQCMTWPRKENPKCAIVTRLLCYSVIVSYSYVVV